MNKSEKEVVYQLAGEKYKTLFVFIWITLAMYIGAPMLMGILNMEDYISLFMPICSLSGMAFIIILIVYITKMSSVKKSVKTLAATGKLDFANEIISGDYNTDGKMGFSKHLLYDKKTKILVAYDDILWIYKKARDRYTTEVLFCTVDGRKHRSRIEDITLNEFLRRRSGILLGFTPQNDTVYNMKVKEFKEKNKVK